MRYEFDQDTAVEKVADGVFTGEISDRWSIGSVPNGGYTMSIALAAGVAESAHPDPLTATAHFLSRVEPGPCRIEVEHLRSGRTTSVVEVRLHQEKEKLRMLATYGDLHGADGLTEEPRLDLPELDDCVDTGRASMPGSIDQRFEYSFTPESFGFALGEPAGRAVMEGWVRFSDGRSPTLDSLALIADCFPPAAFNFSGVSLGWVPTLEMTVHFRRRPESSWVFGALKTDHLVDGYMEEDGRFYDAGGRLVAMSRQFARLL